MDEATKKVSLKSTAPGVNYDFYGFLDPVLEYVDKHSPYILELDNDKLPTKVKFVSAADNNVWFSVAKQ